MINPTPEFPLSELTSTMIREVFEAVSSSSMDQARAYAEVAAKVALPYDVYLAEVIGGTLTENEAAARRFIVEAVLPLLGLPSAPIPDPLLFSVAKRDELRHLFSGQIVQDALVDDMLVPAGNFLSIAYADLEAFALARMRDDTDASYRSLRTLMAAGMPSVVVTGGQVCTKVTMRISTEQTSSSSGRVSLGSRGGSTALNVRVAEERSVALARSLEVVGSVRVDFRTSTFPSTEQSVP